MPESATMIDEHMQDQAQYFFADRADVVFKDTQIWRCMYAGM